MLYPLLPLSVFSAIEDFFDISDVEVISDFFDIMFKDVGGVGLGEDSVATSNSAQTLESLTPVAKLLV